jgi:hypothetical protein
VISPTNRAPHARLRAVVAVGLTAFALLTSIASLLIWAGTPLDVVTFIAMPLAFGGIGAFLWVRVPGNPIGPMLLIATIGFAALIGSGAWLVATVKLPSHDPLAIFLGLVTNLAFVPALVIGIVGVPLVFPDGRFLSPRWRWVAIVAAITVALAEIRTVIGKDELMNVPGLRNPFYRPDLQTAFTVWETVETTVAAILFVAAIWSLVLRYRRSDDIGRHQIRWLAAASAVAVVGTVLGWIVPAWIHPFVDAIGILGLNAIPVAIGIAVVRYRLYEIDRLISRGISYAIITIALLWTYAAAVLVLQGPIGSLFGSQTVTVALSTLVVAGLFQPVRRRIQRAVDRRFDRAHVDAERTTTAFSDRLRDEVDIDAVLADLASTARGAVSPASMHLWLREPTPAPAVERPG